MRNLLGSCAWGGHPGETPCHWKRQSSPRGCGSPWCQNGPWPVQQSCCVLLVEPLVLRDPQAPSRSTGWVGPHSSPMPIAGGAGCCFTGAVPGCWAASAAWLRGSWHLAHAATMSHQHCWYKSFYLGSCILQLHVRAPSRFTVFHYCISGTWRRTAACVLCTLTSDRTLAGNGSMSLRATLLTSVQALVHTFAAQTPLTARYILYIILPGLVAVLAPSSLSLINIQSLQSSISSSDQYLWKTFWGNCRKKPRWFSQEDVLAFESVLSLLADKSWGKRCYCLLDKMWNKRTDGFRVLTWQWP